MTIEPIAREVVPVKRSVLLKMSVTDAEAKLRDVASSFGANMVTSPRGNPMVVLSHLGAAKLDENCVYPVVNRKTGGHTYTYLSWQHEVARRIDRRLVTGDFLLEMSLKTGADQNTNIEYWSNCAADTELGRLPALSTGLFEEHFFRQILEAAGQRVRLDRPTVDPDVPAEEIYVANSKFIHGPHLDKVRRLLPGVSNRTSVRFQVSKPRQEVWQAALRATRQFGELSGCRVQRVDETLGEIQSGDMHTPSHTDNEKWANEFVTAIRGDAAKSQIVVTRTLLIVTADGEMRGAPSDGFLESWIITKIIDDLSPTADKEQIAPPTISAPRENPKSDVPNCTVDQILKMKELGLADDQIKAACVR